MGVENCTMKMQSNLRTDQILNCFVHAFILNMVLFFRPMINEDFGIQIIIVEISFEFLKADKQAKFEILLPLVNFENLSFIGKSKHKSI